MDRSSFKVITVASNAPWLLRLNVSANKLTDLRLMISMQISSVVAFLSILEKKTKVLYT